MCIPGVDVSEKVRGADKGNETQIILMCDSLLEFISALTGEAQRTGRYCFKRVRQSKI